ncbi:zinc finger protein ZAT2-like [Papaver somniferum]|uniref:zinc finger protein ZAT2-like n=1 Tax=Papaver somniferum TaxID=3469 RepID=UPI000E6F808E|nr:zinc finger protein ZAT2-like [Papaver somniferum]
MDRRENNENQSHPLLTSSPDQEHAESTNLDNEESMSRSQDHAEDGVLVISQGNGDVGSPRRSTPGPVEPNSSRPNVNVEDGVGQSATAIPEGDVAVGLPRCFVQGESSAPIPRNVADIDPSSLVFHPGLSTKSGKKTRKNKKVQGIRIGMKEGQPSNPFLDLNRFPSCYECKKEFFSWKAVHGHMRTHPEREWRGTVPPPNVARPSFPVAADENRESPAPATNQEVEVATGLLLLSFTNSRGVLVSSANNSQDQEPQRSRQVTENSASSSNARYECSVYKKVFLTHQGLGGHRASHKNVKGCHAMDNTAAEHHSAERNGGETSGTGNIFGCHICLRRFASGQALGGHMRRHPQRREEASSSAQDPNVDPTSLARIGLVVDLNLPLPPNIPPPPYLRIENDEGSSASSSSSSSSPSPDTSLDLHL